MIPIIDHLKKEQHSQAIMPNQGNEANGNEIICEGYYCQVFSDSDCTNEIDSFCLAEGFEITDLSDEALAAGIKSYLSLNSEDIAQGEDESQGMSIDL